MCVHASVCECVCVCVHVPVCVCVHVPACVRVDACESVSVFEVQIQVIVGRLLSRISH